MKKNDLRAVAAIALFYLFIDALGVTCPIRFITGISCAGCGMSRAWMSLLRLDIPAAFAYHPLFLLPVPMAAMLLFRKKLPDKSFKCCLIVVCVLFTAVYLFRMLSPEDQIVVFQPSQGIIPRALSGLPRAGG